MLTCIHTATGLCDSCQVEYDADPAAFVEYGCHVEGIRRWQELQDELEAAFGGVGSGRELTAEEEASIPF